MTAPWWFWVILVVGFSIGGYIPAGWKAYKWLRRRRNSRADTGLFQQKSEGPWSPSNFPYAQRDGIQKVADDYLTKRRTARQQTPAAECKAYAGTGGHAWLVGGTCGFCDAVVDPLDLE